MVVGWVEPRFIEARPTGFARELGGPHAAMRPSTHPTGASRTPSEMTTMPVGEAKNRNLPMPRRPVSGLTFQGLEVRSGLLRAQIPGIDVTAYVFPCYFLGD